MFCFYCPGMHQGKQTISMGREKSMGSVQVGLAREESTKQYDQSMQMLIFKNDRIEVIFDFRVELIT